MKAADTSCLVGRHYAAKSGNVCTLRALGEGAVRAGWKLNPSQTDTQELDAWVVSLLSSVHGAEVVATVCTDESKEAEMYEEWKKQ